MNPTCTALINIIVFVCCLIAIHFLIQKWKTYKRELFIRSELQKYRIEVNLGPIKELPRIRKEIEVFRDKYCKNKVSSILADQLIGVIDQRTVENDT